MQLFEVEKEKKKRDYPYRISFDRKKNGTDHFDKFMEAIGKVFSEAKFDPGSRSWYVTEAGLHTLKYYDSLWFPRKEEQKPKEKKKSYSVSRLQDAIKNDTKQVTGYEHIGDMLRLKPYKYQKEVIKFCLDAGNALIVCPCGSGKTPMLIGIYAELRSRGKISGPGMIVVKASLKTQWAAEIRKFSDYTPHIIETYKACKNDEAFYDQFEGADLYVLNYETLRDERVRQQLHKRKIEFVAADEVKNEPPYTAMCGKINQVNCWKMLKLNKLQQNPRG